MPLLHPSCVQPTFLLLKWPTQHSKHAWHLEKTAKGQVSFGVDDLYRPSKHPIPASIGTETEFLKKARDWKAAGFASNRVATAATAYLLEDQRNEWSNAQSAWACFPLTVIRFSAEHKKAYMYIVYSKIKAENVMAFQITDWTTVKDSLIELDVNQQWIQHGLPESKMCGILLRLAKPCQPGYWLLSGCQGLWSCKGLPRAY